MKGSVNILMVMKVVGWLLIIESAFMVVPLITSVIYEESDMWAFVWTVAITFTVGLGLTFGLRPSRSEMAKREGFLLTALVWIVFSIFGMLPFLISETPLSVSDAFFEAMSGFTTTGSSVLTTLSGLSHGILLWRCLMQWLGGMGIILFTLAVIPMLNHAGGMQMFNAEVTGITHDKLRPRISSTAKGLWLVYIYFTCALIILLWLGPMDLFNSICYAFSTISTGGFSTTDAGVAIYNSVYVKTVLVAFMFLGGTSFSLMYRAGRGDFRSLFSNDVFKTYVRMIGFFFLMFAATIVINGRFDGLESVTIDPLFQVVSTITSTGLAVSDFWNWGTFALSLTFVLMFFGSCAGSTSGGAKIDRMLFLLKNIRNEIYRSLHPNAILSVRINGNVVSRDIVSKVIAFLCLFVLIIAVGGTVLTAFGVPLVDAFFSATSCISNIGYGADITGYGEGYSTMPDVAKWILSALMLIGRLEIFTILILFTQGFWKR